MTAPRSRREAKNYDRYLQVLAPGACVFCAIQPSDNHFVKETPYFKVVQNLFPYSLWDGHAVIDHLLIMPKTHTASLTNMPGAQKIEFVDLIEAYEKAGYNIYARAPGSKSRSIIHQHTHLIKTNAHPKKLVFLLRKPYLRLSR